jgi:glycosyltransferase involved in cell wall biosynthesis
MSKVLIANPGADLYGSDRMMLQTVDGLVRSGHRVLVTMPYEGALRAEVERRGASVTVLAAPVLRKGYMSPVGLLRLFRSVLAALRPNTRLLRSERPDVVYVSTITIPLWIVLARVFRIPVVCHVHEAEAEAPGVVRRALSAPLLQADKIILNSRFSRSVHVASFGSLERRSEVVYNGVGGPTSVEPPRVQLSDPVRLVYVGRLSARKGVDVAVNALAALRDRGVEAHLTLVGAVFPGYEDYETGLRQRAAALGITDRITFAGFLPDGWAQLAASDIVLVPSRAAEGFGNAAVEGVLAARPVIASKIGGLEEALEGFASAQVVPPDDPDSIARAVTRVVHNWDLYRRHAVEDAVVAAERFSPECYRATVTTVLDQLTSTGGRRA